MKIIICLDDNNGMLFNKRRQSRDITVVYDILQNLRNNKLYISEFSKNLFKDFENVKVTDELLEEAGRDDFCFLEDRDLSGYANRVSEIIIYRWNRVYPADVYFKFPFNNMKLTEVSEFAGNSHEKITKEVYVR